MSSSLVVLCSNHETKDTKSSQINHRLLPVWHPPPRAAQKRSSLTCILNTCSRTAKFVVWLQKQAVESGRDVTTEQPDVDHMPPASGLTCSKKTPGKTHGNYHSLHQKAKVLRKFYSPRSSRVERRKRRISETSFHMDFPLAPPVSAALPYSAGMHKKIGLVSTCTLKTLSVLLL